MKKLSRPEKHKAAPNALTGVDWKMTHDVVGVYERTFANLYELEVYLVDSFGQRFANSVVKQYKKDNPL